MTFGSSLSEGGHHDVALEAPQDEATRLFLRHRSGDPQAFRELFELCHAQAVRVATRMLGGSTDAEEQVQESWAIAVKTKTFDESKRFAPWFFTIVSHKCIDFQRRNRGRFATESLRFEALEDTESGRFSYNPAVETDFTETLATREAVASVLQVLPSAYRRVLKLRDMEGFSFSEIATMERRKEETIRWRLSKAREQFRVAWLAYLRRIERGEKWDTFSKSLS